MGQAPDLMSRRDTLSLINQVLRQNAATGGQLQARQTMMNNSFDPTNTHPLAEQLRTKHAKTAVECFLLGKSHESFTLTSLRKAVDPSRTGPLDAKSRTDFLGIIQGLINFMHKIEVQTDKSITNFV